MDVSDLDPTGSINQHTGWARRRSRLSSHHEQRVTFVAHISRQQKRSFAVVVSPRPQPALPPFIVHPVFIQCAVVDGEFEGAGGLRGWFEGAHHWLARCNSKVGQQIRRHRRFRDSLWFVVVGLCTVVPVRLTIRFAYAFPHPYSFPGESHVGPPSAKKRARYR